MTKPQWHDLGAVTALKDNKLHEVIVGDTRLAVTWVDEQLSVISGLCNHVGGPLGQGRP